MHPFEFLESVIAAQVDTEEYILEKGAFKNTITVYLNNEGKVTTAKVVSVRKPDLNEERINFLKLKLKDATATVEELSKELYKLQIPKEKTNRNVDEMTKKTN